MANSNPPSKKQEQLLNKVFNKLEKDYHYSKEYISIHYPLYLGRRTIHIDAVVFKENGENIPYILIELKTKLSFVEANKLMDYLLLSPATYALLTNGDNILVFRKTDFDLITRILQLMGISEVF